MKRKKRNLRKISQLNQKDLNLENLLKKEKKFPKESQKQKDHSIKEEEKLRHETRKLLHQDQNIKKLRKQEQ